VQKHITYPTSEHNVTGSVEQGSKIRNIQI